VLLALLCIGTGLVLWVSVESASSRQPIAHDPDVLASGSANIWLSGDLPASAARSVGGWMGRYNRRELDPLSGRYVYVKQQDPERRLWHDGRNGHWIAGWKHSQRSAHGALYAVSDALLPELVAPGAWKAFRGKKTGGFVDAPGIHWALSAPY
jgi:hypothetical protein